MDNLSKILLCGCLLQLHCNGVALAGEQVEEVIFSRKLREAGYEHFDVGSLHETLTENTIRSFNTEDLKRRKRSINGADETLQLKVSAHEQTFLLTLKHAKTVIDQNASIVFRRGDIAERWTGERPDCYLTGEVTSHGYGTASFSYCNGLIGSFSDREYVYRLEPLDGERSDQILVGRKRSNETCGCQSDKHVVSMKVPPKVEPPHRSKRQATNYVIEIGVYIDRLYIDYLDSLGATTEVERLNYINMKWNGVQADWGKENELGYDFTLKIKHVEFFETNPTWYNTNTNKATMLSGFCTGVTSQSIPNFDHIHLQSGYTGTGVSGYAFIESTCGSSSKCAMTFDKDPTRSAVMAHEVGHTMGMRHDEDGGCGSADGIMGTNIVNTIDWSSCSATYLADFMGKSQASCLSTEIVTTADVFTITEGYPGMLYTNDEICEVYHSSGWQFRRYPIEEWSNCTQYSCIDMNADSQTFGTMEIHSIPIKGQYCGDDMYCLGTDSCSTFSETGLDASLKTVVIGGWGAWGAETTCSRTCGTGMKIRRRACDSPKPKNNFGCDGNEYDATPCNTQSCDGDSSSESDLITQRAGETCTALINNNIISHETYSGTGQLYWSAGYDLGKCEVKCDRIDGGDTGLKRFGLMPEGTPCSMSEFSGDVEKYSMSRRSGRYSRCVRGQCYIFGCDDTTYGPAIDGCGVCGGSSNTCQVVEGVWSDSVAQGERVEMFTLPTGTHHIQLYYSFSNKYNFIEMYSKDDIGVLGTFLSGTAKVEDSTSNPVNLAGTYWYYVWDKQYLYSEGPINQPVKFKFYSYQGKTNTGINYGYSLPLQSTLDNCNENCGDHGTFNTETCGCDCNSGYYGRLCDTICSKYCPNNASYTSNCKCDCPSPNTYGNKCQCSYPFTGPDCSQCKITSCQNNGIFNSSTCRCTCPDGYGELDCSTPCQNVGDTATCETDAASGKCQTKNENMEANCYLACGLCVESSGTSASTSTTSSTASSTSSASTSTTSSTASSTSSASTSTTSSTTSSTSSASTSTTSSTTSSISPTTTSTTTQSSGTGNSVGNSATDNRSRGNGSSATQLVQSLCSVLLGAAAAAIVVIF